jgi:uncharacterized protein (TIGR00369 family)
MLNSSIQRKHHSNCLLCGQHNPWSLGVKFRAADNGCVRGEFHAHPRLQGYDGVLHGGVITALLDAAMTHSLFHKGIEAVTGDLRVRFLHPIPCDCILDLKACVLSEKSKLYVVKAEIVFKEKIMAKAEAKFMLRPKD